MSARLQYTKKAQKDYPDDGIKKGESFYFWKFAFNDKIFRSKVRPTRSQLQNSSFLSQMYEIEDEKLSADSSEFESADQFEDHINGIIEELEEMAENSRNSLNNMPEHLQETSAAGERLQSRIEAIEEMLDLLGSIDCTDFTYNSPEDVEDDDVINEYGEDYWMEASEENKMELKAEFFQNSFDSWIDDKVQEMNNIHYESE